MGDLYLGLDCSTQGLKATIISGSDPGNIVHHAAVNYDSDLPHFRTAGGMHKVGASVTSPVLMWLEALDLIMSQLLDAERRSVSSSGIAFRLADIVAVSGSGQQHGSVYWAKGASVSLGMLDPGVSLGRQLGYSFSRLASPIWADSSTTKQCAELEQNVGGAVKLSRATGSRAYERFTGNQIAKVATLTPSVYKNTERISLVSSFMCSIFLGSYAPVDTSDGSGTNLNNIVDNGGTSWYSPAIMSSGGEELVNKLGDSMVAPHTVLGEIAGYFVYRYGFSPSCRVVSWSGDNPCSLAGLGLQNAGDVAVSLGTSDTMFAMMSKARPGLDGHVLRNPVDPESFMGMLCFRNGSLAREDVSMRCSNNDWDRFSQLLSQRDPGNDGAVGFYFMDPEITPTTNEVAGIQRYNSHGVPVESFDDATEVRAVVEGKFLAMRLFGEKIGMDIKELDRIVATGGASKNRAILQVLADVFGVPVYTIDQSDSASLGAAFRAMHAYRCDQEGSFVPFSSVVPRASLPYTKAAEPTIGAVDVYTLMLEHFAFLQNKFLAKLLPTAD